MGVEFLSSFEKWCNEQADTVLKVTTERVFIDLCDDNDEGVNEFRAVFYAPGHNVRFIKELLDNDNSARQFSIDYR
jgi:hypothetical protein